MELEFPLIQYVVLPLQFWVQSIQLIDNEAQSTSFVVLAKMYKGFDILAFIDAFTLIGG